MQKIERSALVQAQISGGADKGSNSATSSSNVTLDASNLTVASGATVAINIEANSSAKAG